MRDRSRLPSFDFSKNIESGENVGFEIFEGCQVNRLWPVGSKYDGERPPELRAPACCRLMVVLRVLGHGYQTGRDVTTLLRVVRWQTAGRRRRGRGARARAGARARIRPLRLDVRLRRVGHRRRPRIRLVHLPDVVSGTRSVLGRIPGLVPLAIHVHFRVLEVGLGQRGRRVQVAAIEVALRGRVEVLGIRVHGHGERGRRDVRRAVLVRVHRVLHRVHRADDLRAKRFIEISSRPSKLLLPPLLLLLVPLLWKGDEII